MYHGGMLDISIADQRCRLYERDKLIFETAISSAFNGVGQKKNSGCTPLGLHQIRACIGANKPENTVFIGRRPTSEIYTPELGLQFPERDWILTRILWLSGLELGKNRLANVDTMQRYIYIHGCPDSLPMGEPLSHGCIRMHNKDLLALFDLVEPGTQVMIHE
ncbi:MAG: L,D-transpeptidase [Methylophaga sp.]|nr:L,D-transpeptidase [Methylophaga sp.]